MAETYAPYQNQNTVNDQAQFLHEIKPSNTEAIITSVDFRPDPTHEQIMRRIGEVAALLWQCPENANLLSCEPFSSSASSVNFRVYRSGYDTKNTIPHLNGWSGEESTGLYKISYDAASGQFDTGPIHQRNLRYYVNEIEAQKRAGTYDQRRQTLRRELWGDTND